MLAQQSVQAFDVAMLLSRVARDVFHKHVFSLPAPRVHAAVLLAIMFVAAAVAAMSVW